MMRFWKFLSGGLLIVLILAAFNIAARPVNAQTPEPTAWGADTAAADTAAQPLKLVWQTEFKSDSVLIGPGDIAVDSKGSVYVSNQTTNVIKKFDSDGQFVTQWGANGKGDGQFRLPLGVGVDWQDNVYVTDFNNRRIEKFDSSGTFLLQWATEPNNSPAFIGLDQVGNVYIDKFPLRDDNYFQKFDGSTGSLVSQWGNTLPSDGKSGTRLEDIAVDADGNVYAASPLVHSVLKFDNSGKFLTRFGGDASKDGSGLFDDPFGVTVDSDGNIYVLDSHFLQKLDWQGNFVTQWSTDGGDLDRATNVMVDAEGNIYVFAYADVLNIKGDKVNALILKKFQQSE